MRFEAHEGGSCEGFHRCRRASHSPDVVWSHWTLWNEAHGHDLQYPAEDLEGADRQMATYPAASSMSQALYSRSWTRWGKIAGLDGACPKTSAKGLAVGRLPLTKHICEFIRDNLDNLDPFDEVAVISWPGSMWSGPGLLRGSETRRSA